MAGEFKKIEQEFGKYGSTALFSTLVLLFLLCALVTIGHVIAQTDQGRILNYFVLLLGALCGWALGIFSSPYSASEEKKFGSIAQAISAFISGYALSKFDRFLEASLFASAAVPQNDTWIRLGLFVASAGLFALLIFSNRAYFRTEDIQPSSMATDARPIVAKRL